MGIKDICNLGRADKTFATRVSVCCIRREGRFFPPSSHHALFEHFLLFFIIYLDYKLKLAYFTLNNINNKDGKKHGNEPTPSFCDWAIWQWIVQR